MFLEILLGSATFLKKETLMQLFSCEFWEISKKTFSYRTPPVVAFVSYIFAKEIHSNLFAYYKKNVFSSVLFLRKLFVSLGLFIISLGNCSVIKDILWPWTDFWKIVVPLFLHTPNHLISSNFLALSKDFCEYTRANFSLTRYGLNKWV